MFHVAISLPRPRSSSATGDQANGLTMGL